VDDVMDKEALVEQRNEKVKRDEHLGADARWSIWL
jgi:hypothetical protein